MTKTKSVGHLTQDAIERSGFTMPAFDDWDEWARIEAREEARQEAAAFESGMRAELAMISKAELDAQDAADLPVHRSNPSGAQTRTREMATEKQMHFLKSLRPERDPEFKVVPAVMRKDLTKRVASQMIEKLLALPKIQAPAKPAAPQPRVEVREIPMGTFTIARGDTWRTIQIGHAKWADNKIVASYLSGPDNEASYTGFAFISDSGRVGVWSKFKADSALVEDLRFLIEDANRDAAHEAFLDNAEAYALRSGKCMRCNHKLTVPTSLHRGLGPDCAAREGIA